MRKLTNHSTGQYALIACLSVVLILGQAFRLHMHLEHNEADAGSEHIIDVHIATSSHDTTLDAHHQDDTQNHHPDEIDISLVDIIKKSQWSKLILLLVFVGFVYRLPIYRCIQRRFVFEYKLSSVYYLLRPPLRAPPL